jgi:Ni/Fe-hydrogenase 1 B-type cytochrome subunit
MDLPEFKRVLVWGGWLRLAHASIGLATLVLLLTGWLIADSPSLAESAQDVHYLASAFLISGLGIRIVLMFAGKEHERFSSLFPATTELAAMAATLRFYISLGRTSLPGWYAQNPLWKPVYLAVYLVLIILVVSGATMSSTTIFMGFYMPSVHEFWAHFMLWFSLIHIASVVMHDYKKQTADISAMVNGYRLFLIERGHGGAGVDDSVQVITLDSIKRHD